MPRRNWHGPRKTVQSSDLQDRALGTGDPTSASKSAGKQNARWASVDLTGGGAVVGTVLEYDVPHDLGRVPTVVELVTYENASGPVTITSRGVRQENWSHSHAHAEITLVAGSLDGTVARFLVRGR